MASSSATDHVSANRPLAVVLVSGGMDSCVCAALAARDYEPAFLHVDYGQRTEARERQAFEAIANHYGVRRRLQIHSGVFRQIGGSALTDESLPVPIGGLPQDRPQESVPRAGDLSEGSLRESSLREAGSREDAHREGGLPAEGARKGDPREHGPREDVRRGDEIPITYVPFRNAHFLSAAVSWAEVIGATRIIIGAVEQDSSGYPDCRPRYYEVFNELIAVGTKEGTIRVETPLIAMNKAEIIRLGTKLGAPLELSWSCYQNSEQACGLCDSCRLRLRAFEQAGLPDPLPYAIKR